jgi:hypothetical protein
VVSALTQLNRLVIDKDATAWWAVAFSVRLGGQRGSLLGVFVRSRIVPLFRDDDPRLDTGVLG